MKFENFMIDLRKHVDNFEKEWIANNKSNPEGWPMEFGAADWWEQFTVSGQED